MQTFIVQERIELMAFLEKSLHGIKRSTVKNYLRFEAVFVNGRPVTRFDHPLKPGDKVAIEKDKQKAEVNRLRTELTVNYEDDAILVIEKPAGLLTIATDKVKTNTAFYQAYEYLKTAYIVSKDRKAASAPSKMLFIVHRLDKDASGLLILAKTAEAKFYLQEHWHKFEKKYYAVVEGIPREPSGEIASYLKENKILRVFSSKSSADGGKFSRTLYQVLHTAETRSGLDVTLKTGRKHQIRVHMASIGHPILGDKDYGNTAISKRLALHAYSLSIEHPITKKQMLFKSEIPQELKRLLA